MAKDKSKSGKRAVEDSAAASASAKKPRSSSSSGKSKGKGRSEDNSTGAGKVSLCAADKNVFDVGPVLVSASDFELPEEARFTLHYRPQAPPSPDEAGASGSNITMSDSMILAGETESMDLVGWNWDLNADLGKDVNARRTAKGYAGEFIVGVYDPDAQTVTLRQAPLFTLHRSVKALNSLSAGVSNSYSDWQERVLARRELGESFGNRKTKAKARNEDRMKVDTSNMVDVMDTLRSKIDETTQGLPTAESIEEEANQQRPIPPPNLQALVPHEAYPISALIPDAVLRMIQSKDIEAAESADQLGKFINRDAARAPWIKTRLWTLVQSSQSRKKVANSSPKKIDFDAEGEIAETDGSQQSVAGSTGILKTSKETSRLKLKVAIYICILLGFVRNAKGPRRGGSKEDLLRKLGIERMSGGELILEDLFARFTELQRGEKRGTITNYTETKLYAYLFALCMHLDDFSLNPIPLAKDLGMASQRASEIFKSLGCSSSTVNVKDDKKEIRVILKCPVQLPKPRRGRA